jgi:hypothetical protein
VNMHRRGKSLVMEMLHPGHWCVLQSLAVVASQLTTPKDGEVLMHEPDPQLELTPISKLKRAQARFANALFDICAPAFEPVTWTVLPVLQSFQATVAPASTPTHVIPAVPIPCSRAIVPVVLNPLSPTAPPSSDFKKARQRELAPAPAFQEVERACVSISLLLRGQHKKGRTIRRFSCNDTTCCRLERMEMMMRIVMHRIEKERKPWIAASLHVAQMHGKSTAKAESL